MKLYKRSDFILLPSGTIYSRVHPNSSECGPLMSGLFCKTTDKEYGNDWVEQDLIAEPGFPNKITTGPENIEYQLERRDSFEDFETDLDCGGRDGMFEDSDVFVVWNKQDVIKLRDYLNDVL